MRQADKTWKRKSGGIAAEGVLHPASTRDVNTVVILRRVFEQPQAGLITDNKFAETSK